LAIAGLVSNADLDLPRTANEVVPLILTSHGIEVWYKFDASKENIVAQVIC
jgi:hypothetical protein